ncbi:MAG: MBOAT family protein [Nitrospirae bacterium]|nr:MBOAT family protein [Nitrospirota bacterium]
MLFNSWGYIIFLFIVVPMHWLLPHRFRTGFFALASLGFYSMWSWEFTFLLLFTIIVDYVAARKIVKTETPSIRKIWLVSSLIINLGLLAFFKYTYFILDNVGGLFSIAGIGSFSAKNLGISIILPLGISFYTFHSISYTIDTYRRVIQPTKNFITFTAYVLFWPQLAAGPILRANEVIPQFQSERKNDWGNIARGIEYIIVGLFLKVALADSVAPAVDFWFSTNIEFMTALDVWVAAFLFGFQIYFDFAGYSYMAMGSALLVGIKLPENFNWPYFATSPKEFWKRWHISLSSWIRDYLYLPLTGQKFRTKSEGGLSVGTEDNKLSRQNQSLIIVWAIMGLWHGAKWTFVFWGIYHSLIVLLYRKVRLLDNLSKNKPVLAWIVMLPLAMAGWIFFRARSLKQSLLMFGMILNPFMYKFSSGIKKMTNPFAGWSYIWALLIFSGMICLYIIKVINERNKIPFTVKWSFKGAALAVMVFFILLLIKKTNQFIYFQF